MSIQDAGDDATIIAKQIVQYLNEAEGSEYVATLYVKGCEALHVAGTPREQCGAKFAKVIRDLKYPNDPKREWHSGHYWDVVKRAGFTRSSGGKNPAPAQEKKISSLLKPEDPTTWLESPFYRQRLPLIEFLQQDVAMTQQMILELQRNFEQKEMPDGSMADDEDNPRQWFRLFSSITVRGEVSPYPAEDVTDYLKAITNYRAKMQKVWQGYMDKRVAMMPWMIWPLKMRGDIISKAWWGKQYYVMFKRKDALTPKKLTQFEESRETYADYLNFVGADSWKHGYCEFIPCPHCLINEKSKIEYEGKRYLLEMFPFEDGHWQWHCANCNTFFNPNLLTQVMENASRDTSGMALIYLQRAGMPIPQETDQELGEADEDAE